MSEKERDMDGLGLRARDVVGWCYGIPPVFVESDVVEYRGVLMARHRGEHRPTFSALRNLRKHGYEFRRVKRGKKP